MNRIQFSLRNEAFWNLSKRYFVCSRIKGLQYCRFVVWIWTVMSKLSLSVACFPLCFVFLGICYGLQCVLWSEGKESRAVCDQSCLLFLVLQYKMYCTNSNLSKYQYSSLRSCIEAVLLNFCRSNDSYYSITHDDPSGATSTRLVDKKLTKKEFHFALNKH